jgi:hypothetical protein
MAVIIQEKAGVTLLFGLDGGVASIAGTIGQDADQGVEASEFTVTDKDGTIAATSIINQIGTFKFTGLIPSGFALPAAGSIVAAGGLNYIVMKANKKQTNTKFSIASLDLKRYINLSIP